MVSRLKGKVGGSGARLSDNIRAEHLRARCLAVARACEAPPSSHSLVVGAPSTRLLTIGRTVHTQPHRSSSSNSNNPSPSSPSSRHHHRAHLTPQSQQRRPWSSSSHAKSAASGAEEGGEAGEGKDQSGHDRILPGPCRTLTGTSGSNPHKFAWAEQAACRATSCRTGRS